MDESLGLPSGQVIVSPYNPRWAVLFEMERERISTAADRARLQLSVEHTGSTAVVGLAAKPIIDILAGWHRPEDRASIITMLTTLGYEHRGENGIAGREFFRRGEPRAYHLHLATRGGVFWHDHLAFRDLLRAEPSVAAEYAALKHELASRYPRDRPAYIEGKAAFVAAVLVRARAIGMYGQRE